MRNALRFGGIMAKGPREFPKKKENPRNAKLLIAVTYEEKAAFAWEAGVTNTSQSDVAYKMLNKRGGLPKLLARYRAESS
jgi:hypothetical protein